MGKKKAQPKSAAAASSAPKPAASNWEAEHRKELQAIVDRTNNFARLVYSMHGNQVPDGYKFYDATHPQEVGCWNIAVAALEFFEGSDATDALNELRDDEAAAGD